MTRINHDRGHFIIEDTDDLLEMLTSPDFKSHIQRNHFNAATLERWLDNLVEAAQEIIDRKAENELERLESK